MRSASAASSPAPSCSRDPLDCAGVMPYEQVAPAVEAVWLTFQPDPERVRQLKAAIQADDKAAYRAALNALIDQNDRFYQEQISPLLYACGWTVDAWEKETGIRKIEKQMSHT